MLVLVHVYTKFSKTNCQTQSIGIPCVFEEFKGTYSILFIMIISDIALSNTTGSTNKNVEELVPLLHYCCRFLLVFLITDVYLVAYE